MRFNGRHDGFNRAYYKEGINIYFFLSDSGPTGWQIAAAFVVAGAISHSAGNAIGQLW